jgi:hypothetical protein
VILIPYDFSDLAAVVRGATGAMGRAVALGILRIEAWPPLLRV